ncbi:MAG: TRAM domain-containing protein, partial [Bacteroidales bacterium]
MKYYNIENLEIIDAGSEGKAVGKQNGLTIFVPFVVPGDVVDVQVFKKKRGYAEANMIALKKASPDRVEKVCAHFGLCGGCKWQIMDYATQLHYKQKQVNDNFKYIGKFEYPEIETIIPSERKYFYRNKLEFTFSNLRWLDEEDMNKQDRGEKLEVRGLGFHIPGKFDKVLDIEKCYLQTDPSNDIRLAVKKFALENEIDFYNIRNHEGILRNMIIRTTSTQELMVIMVMTEKNEKTMKLMQFLADKFPEINSLQYVVNTKLNDTITDLEIITYKGNSFIREKMEDLSFKIGPV